MKKPWVHFYKFLVLRSMYFLKFWIETDYASAGLIEAKVSLRVLF